MGARSFYVRAASVLAAAVTLLTATIAAAEDIRVTVDQAIPVRLAGPAEGVAIGNPAIAGVSVQNDQMLFVTGRTYGTTNLVVVGANGRLLYSGRIVVTPDESGNTVIMMRGTEVTRLDCSPMCRGRADVAGPNGQ
jgi:Flp pilus assembly secretin CpaC